MCEMYVICLRLAPFVCNVMLCEKHGQVDVIHKVSGSAGKTIDENVGFKTRNCTIYGF